MHILGLEIHIVGLEIKTLGIDIYTLNVAMKTSRNLNVGTLHLVLISEHRCGIIDISSPKRCLIISIQNVS